MLAWLTTPQTEVPAQLSRAYTTAHRRTRLDRYRSRTNVTVDNILTALTWMRLPRILEDGTLGTVPTYLTYYGTRAIPRGVQPEEAVTFVTDTIVGVLSAHYQTAVMTFNTANAATASQAVKEWLDNAELYTELAVRPMLTSTPNHKIHVYKTVDDGRTLYVVLNNVDTPDVVFKLGAALLVDSERFGEATNNIAAAYLSGNGNEVHEKLREYYAEYERHRQEHAITDAINGLREALTEGRERELTSAIESAQNRIDEYYYRIAEATSQLNECKANYLLFKLTDENAKTVELETYLRSLNQNLTALVTADSVLKMAFKTPLMYFESELLQRYFDSTRTNVVNSAPAWKQQLLKDLFIDVKAQLMIESGASIGMRTSAVNFVNPTTLRTDLMTVSQLEGIPNPHHYYYNCWGDNKPRIIRALDDRDFVLAITQICAAMAGLNLADAPVMEKFVRYELNEYANTPCIKLLETNEIITITEYERRYNASNTTNE